MLQLLLLLTLPVHAQNSSCSVFGGTGDVNCFRACEENILVECKKNPEANDAPGVAIVNLSKAYNIHSSELKGFDSAFLTSYQTVHGAMDLDSAIDALATVEYSYEEDRETYYTLLPNQTPKLFIRKGAKSEYTLPFIFNKDCLVSSAYTVGLSQMQGLGYVAELEEGCEASSVKKLSDYETFEGKFTLRALEMESRKNLPKGQTPQTFFIGKMLEGNLYLEPRVYMTEPNQVYFGKVSLPLSSYSYLGIQRKLTFKVKDQTQILNFPVLNRGFQDITSIEFKLKDPNALVESPSGPVFTFKTPKTLMSTSKVSVSSKSIELLGDLIKSPTVYLSDSEELSFSPVTSIVPAPLFKLVKAKTMKVDETQNRLRNPVFLRENDITFSPNLFLARVKTKDDSIYLLLKNKNAQQLKLNTQCMSGEFIRFQTLSGTVVSKIKLAEKTSSGKRKLTAKELEGKTINLCLPNDKSTIQTEFKLTQID
ncbi:MAG: hypothetical protein KA715_11110 [Xanthomonadaceae bacterium]|nr:hypothetical protein [Xanthomonadaceae bacterium]